MSDDSEGLAWVNEDAALVARLEQNWPGWDAEGDTGLAGVLENDSSWQGHEGWTDEERRTQLAASLDEWYSATDEAAAPAEADWEQAGAPVAEAAAPVAEASEPVDDESLWAAALAQFGASWSNWDGTEDTWAQYRDWFYEATNSTAPEMYAVAYQRLQPLEELAHADRVAALRALGFDVSGSDARDAEAQLEAIQALADDPAVAGFDRAALDELLQDPAFEQRMSDAQDEIDAVLAEALAELDELEPS